MYKTVGWGGGGEGVQNSRVGGGCTKQQDGGGRVYKTVGWGEGVQNSRGYREIITQQFTIQYKY